MDERIIILDINKNILKKERYRVYSKDSLLKVEIIENNKIVNLSSYIAKVYFELPNKEIINRPCDIIDNKININLTEDLFINKGKIYFEIILDNSKQKVTTFLTCLEVI